MEIAKVESLGLVLLMAGSALALEPGWTKSAGDSIDASGDVRSVAEVTNLRYAPGDLLFGVINGEGTLLWAFPGASSTVNSFGNAAATAGNGAYSSTGGFYDFPRGFVVLDGTSAGSSVAISNAALKGAAIMVGVNGGAGTATFAGGRTELAGTVIVNGGTATFAGGKLTTGAPFAVNGGTLALTDGACAFEGRTAVALTSVSSGGFDLIGSQYQLANPTFQLVSNVPLFVRPFVDSVAVSVSGGEKASELKVGSGGYLDMYGGKLRIEGEWADATAKFEGGVVRGLRALVTTGAKAKLEFGETRFFPAAGDANGADTLDCTVAKKTEILVTGGCHQWTSIPVANNTVTFRQTGGLFGGNDTTGLFAKTIGNPGWANAFYTITLDGGVLVAPALNGAYGDNTGFHGDVKLLANGGTFRPTVASTTSIQKYRTAAVGEKGLTVEADFDVSIPQAFTEQEGHEGKGTLVMAGRAVKTLSSKSSVSVLDLIGGKTVLGTGDRHQASHLKVHEGATASMAGSPTAPTVAELTLGDASTYGTLEFDAGDKLTVSGNATINAAAVAFTAPLAAAGTYDLVSVGGTCSGDWAATRLVRGRADGVDYAFGSRSDGGKTILTLTVTANGSATAAFDATYGGIDFANNGRDGVYRAEVSGSVASSDDFAVPGVAAFELARDASVTLAGDVSANRLVKTGKGTLKLTGENRFSEGIDVDGGNLEVTSAAALGTKGLQKVLIRDGQLTLADATPGKLMPLQLSIGVTNSFKSAKVWTNGVVLCAKSDVRLIRPLNNGDGGGVYVKKGPGRLTLDNYYSRGETLTGNNYNNGCSYTDDTTIRTSFDDANGEVKGYYGAIAVGEGELELRGGDYGYYNNWTIGLPVKDELAAPPRLTLNGAHVGLYNADFRVSKHLCAANFSGHDVYLTLTNGAFVGLAGTFETLKNADFAVTSHVDIVAGSVFTVGASGKFVLNNAGGKKDPLGVLTVRDSTLAVPTIEFSSGVEMLFDNARVYNTDGSPMASIKASNNWWSYGTLTFCGGTDLRLAKIDATSFSGTSVVNYVFDDCRWTVSQATSGSGYTALPAALKQTKVEIREGGLEMPVNGDCTLTNYVRFEGTGRLVKTGTGTMVFPDCKVLSGSNLADDASGAKDVLAGSVDLAVREGTAEIQTATAVRSGLGVTVDRGATLELDGNTFDFAKLGGAGTVRNGTLVGTKVDAADVTAGAPGVLTLQNVKLQNPSFRFSIGDDAVPAGIVALDADSAVSGENVTIDLGRDAVHPFAKPTRIQDVTLATYAGAAPDVSKWTLTIDGTNPVKGAVKVADGLVTVTLKIGQGLMLILR